MGRIIHESTPLKTVSYDIVGPYIVNTKTGQKTHYIVSFTDICTRFTKIEFIYQIDSKTVINAFKIEWIRFFAKTPEILVSDQELQYTSGLFEDFFNKYHIKHVFSTANDPTSNSQSERINKCINVISRIYYNKDIKLYELKDIIERRLNMVYYSYMNCSHIN